MTTPIETRIQELATRYYRGLEVLQVLDGPMSVNELAADLDIDVATVRERVAYLEEFDRVSRDGTMVRRSE